jgi:di/tricarboxylate transporter
MDTMTLMSMSWQAWLTVGVVLGIFGLLVFTRLPVDFVFPGGLTVLFVSGVLGRADALSGFSSSGMITVGVLYVVVAGLQETGALNWITVQVLGHPRSMLRAQIRLMLPVSGLSAFLNNTPVVAMFIPVVNEWARRLKFSPSRLLIPLSYASIFGGICTLIGTSTNLVVNGLVQQRYQSGGLHMFTITAIGVPCALAGMVYIVLVGRKLLPDRKDAHFFFENPREYTVEMLVPARSPLIGKTIEQAGLRHLTGGFLVEIIRSDHVISAVPPNEVLRTDDRLVFAGVAESIRELRNRQGLRVATDQIFRLNAPRRERCLVEAVVSDTCPLVHQSIREGRFRERYNAVVIAVARNGERIRGKIGDIVLRPGDTLLIESHAGFIPRQKDSRDFYLISRMDDSTPVDYRRAPLAFVILAAMVLAAALGIMSMLQAALLAAGAMLISGCCSPAQARRSIEWSVLLVIASALGLGLALEKTGAAQAIAGGLIELTGNRPWLTLAGVYLATTLFTEIITNNAAAALIFPIAMSTADRLEVNCMPFVICIMVAASASFATPIGYQTNLMVYGPGGYRFSDFMKMGIPLNLLMGIVAVALAPLIWHF